MQDRLEVREEQSPMSSEPALAKAEMNGQVGLNRADVLLSGDITRITRPEVEDRE